MEADIALMLVLVGGFLLGIFRGPVRQLVGLGVVLVAFLVAAYLRPTVGDWISAQAVDYSREYNEMLAFGLSFAVLGGLGLIVVQVVGTTTHLTRRPTFDAILGGLLGIGVALISLAVLMIVLDTYYAAEQSGASGQLAFVRELEAALRNSAIARSIHESLVPLLLTVFGPLLPADVRAPTG